MEKNLSTLEKNLSKIIPYNPDLAEKIRKHNFADEVRLQLINSESGDVNLIYNGVALHDLKNPQQEAFSIFKQNTNSSSISLILGFGLGYLFKRAVISSKGKIIIYEPNLDILRFTLEVADFSQDMDFKRVYFANTKEELIKALNAAYEYKSSINLYALTSGLMLYKNELEELKAFLPDIIANMELNFQTLFKNSYLWASQGVQNIPHFLKNYSIDSLRGRFENKPAVIVSSGPSLDKSIEVLKANRDKYLIFCVANAYKTLVKHDIKPDFLVFVEANEITNQVKYLDTSGLNFIVHSVANNFIYKLDALRKFVFYCNNDLMTRWLSDITGLSAKDYENKGTVSYCAMNSAYVMGCNPIILVGQDLAYTDNKCYSSESSFGALKCTHDNNTNKFRLEVDNIQEFIKYYVNEKYCIKGRALLDQGYSDLNPDETYLIHSDGKLFTLKEFIEMKLDELNQSITFVKGQNGQMMPSDSNYAGFVQYFEEFAYEKRLHSPELELYNASVGGAQINGFENLSLEDEAKNLSPINFNLDFILVDAISKFSDPVKNHSGLIISRLKELVADI